MNVFLCLKNTKRLVLHWLVGDIYLIKKILTYLYVLCMKNIDRNMMMWLAKRVNSLMYIESIRHAITHSGQKINEQGV